MKRTLGIVWLVAVMLAASLAPATAQQCRDNRLALQVLGSGGPVPSQRASSGYLLWRNGRSVVLVDAGGGVFQRFGQAGGRIADLRLVAISHLHPDHSSDIPALLWLTQFRTEPLRMAGPSGSPEFPAFDVFLDRLVGTGSSAWPIVAGRSVPIEPLVADVSSPKPTVVYSEDGLTVSARGVPHNAPSLAYRVDVDGASLVFGSDQTGTDEAFVEFARDADVLLMHLALSPNADPNSTTGRAHAVPAVVGEVAAAAGAKGLVLSHIIVPRPDDPAAAGFSGESQDTLIASAQAVRRGYGGTIVVAEDLQCIVLQP